MSWSYNVTGRAGKIAETLSKSVAGDKVIRIEANGSAWNNQDGSANSQSCNFKFEMVGNFIE